MTALTALTVASAGPAVMVALVVRSRLLPLCLATRPASKVPVVLAVSVVLAETAVMVVTAAAPLAAVTVVTALPRVLAVTAVKVPLSV